MRVCSVIGVRPQFVKAAVVSRAIREVGTDVLVHTGQHYDEEMSAVFFEELGIPEPAYNLGIAGESHGTQTGEMTAALEPVVTEIDPDVLLLYGDTNSTLAGAIVGSKLDITVAHVEAGLRSFNREMPEEINRVLTDHAADFHFAPSKQAVRNLEAEGLTDGVYWTGDVMYDAILEARTQAQERSTVLTDYDLTAGEFILTTVHRQANTDDAATLRAILEGLTTAECPVVFPAHPRTVSRLKSYGLWERTQRALTVIEPQGYLDFVRLLDAARQVATDSGGVQKEAFFLETPCVTMREETEWTETVSCGWNQLVGADAEAIRAALSGSTTPGTKPHPYGDGLASRRIVHTLEQQIEMTEPTLSVSPLEH